MESPNVTLNMLISVQGAEYFTLLYGTTDTIRFWDFLQEACQAADPVSGRPAHRQSNTWTGNAGQNYATSVIRFI